MASNTSFFIQGVNLNYKPGILNPTHATEWTHLEDQGGLTKTLHFYGPTVKLTDIQQRTDKIHRLHCAVAHVARFALNLVAGMTMAPIGTLYHTGRWVVHKVWKGEMTEADYKGLKYDFYVTLGTLFSLGMGYIVIKHFRLLVRIDYSLPFAVPLLGVLPALFIGSFRPYYGQPAAAQTSYLLAEYFGLVQENGGPLQYDPVRDDETWEYDARNEDLTMPKYDKSVMFRLWMDAAFRLIVSFREVMGSDLNANNMGVVVLFFKNGSFEGLRKMATENGKDVTKFDEALRQYDLAWKMNLEIGKRYLTAADPTKVHHPSGWGYAEVEHFFRILRTSIFEGMEANIQNLLQPPPNPLQAFKDWLDGLDVEQIPRTEAKQFLIAVKALMNQNLELDEFREELKKALFKAADPEASPVPYARLKKQANFWFHPDKNKDWSEIATEAHPLYQAIISVIDTGVAEKN